jgi:uncharacterized sulfatase
MSRISRREFLPVLPSLTVGLLRSEGFASAAEGAAGGPGRRPNVVLIISDDHGWTDYGFMGHPHVRTPRLDALASQSVCFTHGYVPTPLCCPSLASIITGRYPHEHGIAFNDPPLLPDSATQAEKDAAFRAGRARMNAFLEAQPTLPRLLAREGYVSFQAGKWWQGHFSHGGFTHGMSHGDESKGGRHGDVGLEIGRKTMQPVFDFIAMARRESRPFFVWYAPMLPHAPHNPPERLVEKYRAATPSIHVARYWAMIEWFDETCGQLLDCLEKQGVADDTIVAYVADNGWIQNPDKPNASVRSKLTPYDAGLRTPILLRWPGQIAAARIGTPVSSVDLMPTLLRALAVEPPGGLPGLNLLDERAVAGRDMVCGAVFAHNAIRIEDPASGLDYRWCIVNGWKLIDPNPQRRGPTPERRGPTVKEGKARQPELYHVSEDPREEKDLAGRESDRVRELRRRLDAWWSPGATSL